MVTDFIGVIGLTVFLLFLLCICWISAKYGGGDKYYGYSRKPQDPIYWTSTIVYPKETDKEN